MKLTQGLDSAVDANGISQGKVTKSTNPALPAGTTVTMGIKSDPADGGYIVKLTEVVIDGKTRPANSSDVFTAPDFMNRAMEKTRGPGKPQDTVRGQHIFLPQNMIVRFALAEPGPEQTAKAAVRSGPTTISVTSPSVGPVGGETFNPLTAPRINSPAILALDARIRGGVSTVLQPGMDVGFSTFTARENVIIGGVIQPAPPGFFRGMRGARMNPGLPFQILDVRAIDDGEHDILHIILENDALPTYANVAFAFSKGELASLTEPALEKVLSPFLSIPRGPARPTAASSAKPAIGAEPQYLYVLEGIGLRMTLDQVRAAAKVAGSVKGPVKQGPTTYNILTKDLAFQIEIDAQSRVYQYNVSALNPRKLPETDKSGPLYNHLIRDFGPSGSWPKSINYGVDEGIASAIVTDPAN